MDKREAQEVVNETVNGLVGGYIVALMVIAALPVIGWALLFGLAGAIASPGVAALIVVGLVVWALVAGWRRGANLKRANAAAAGAWEARVARIKEPHGGKDRYFVREGYKITLMRFNRGNPGGLRAGYYWAETYDLPYRMRGSEHSLVRSAEADMWSDPKRLAHWQAVFDEWIETGVKPPQETWWMFPDELAQHEEREAEHERLRAVAVCPENPLTHGFTSTRP